MEDEKKSYHLEPDYNYSWYHVAIVIGICMLAFLGVWKLAEILLIVFF